MKDALGRNVTLYDYIVWPTMRGDRIIMRSGQVLRVNDKSIYVCPTRHIAGYWAYGKNVTIHRTENVVVVLE